MRAPSLFDDQPAGRFECPQCGARVELLIPSSVPKCCNPRHAARVMVATSARPRSRRAA